MKIIAPMSATFGVVHERLLIRPEVNARFVDDMLPALWSAAVKYAIDPVGMIAQSGKETKWGNFGGKVKPQFYNTAGIKVGILGLFPGIDDGDNPLAHSRFASWEVGAEAHAQHLRKYAGFPVIGLIVDPRYHLVSADSRVTDWSGLGGKWAPSPTYGTEIEQIMATLR